MKKKETALVKADKSVLALEFGKAEVELIKESKCPESTEAEFKLFLYDSQSRGLNPLKNEIYFVKRMVYNSQSGTKEGRASHQVGIDGFRVIAQRSGEYEGQTEVRYGEPFEFKGVKTFNYAEVGIHRKGFKEPLYARAYFAEYCQVYGAKVATMWAKMPRLMIAKCAEALALRKAFPDCLAGLYTNDEMAQADKEKATDVKVLEGEKEVVKESPNRKKLLSSREEQKDFDVIWKTIMSLYKWDKDEAIKNLQKMTGDKNISDLTGAELNKLTESLHSRLDAEVKARKESEKEEEAEVEKEEKKEDEDLLDPLPF